MAKPGHCIEVTTLRDEPQDWFIHEDAIRKCVCFGFIDDKGVRRDVGRIGRDGKLERVGGLPAGYVALDKSRIQIAKDCK